MPKIFPSRTLLIWAPFVFLTIIFLLMILAPSGKAQIPNFQGKNARCSWDPPTYGTPVEHYVLQVITFGGDDPDTTTYDNITDTFMDVWVKYTFTYKARVAGVDAEGRQGPWSLWTPLYGPEQEP